MQTEPEKDITMLRPLAPMQLPSRRLLDTSTISTPSHLQEARGKYRQRMTQMVDTSKSLLSAVDGVLHHRPRALLPPSSSSPLVSLARARRPETEWSAAILDIRLLN